MIKQDVDISATSFTGDIVGARAPLLADFLLVAERYNESRDVDALLLRCFRRTMK